MPMQFQIPRAIITRKAQGKKNPNRVYLTVQTDDDEFQLNAEGINPDTIPSLEPVSISGQLRGLVFGAGAETRQILALTEVKFAAPKT